MKFKPSQRMLTRGICLFLSLAATIVFALLVTNLGGVFEKISQITRYLKPVFYAFVIAFLLNPLLKIIERHLVAKIRIKKKPLPWGAVRGISMFITYVVAIVLVWAFIGLILPNLGESLGDIQQQIPKYAKNLQGTMNNTWDRLAQTPFVAENAEFLEQILEPAVQTINENFLRLDKWISSVLGGVVSLAGSMVSFLLNFVLGFVISLYFLIEKEQLLAGLRKITSAVFPKRGADFLYDYAKETNQIFNDFIFGRAIDAVIVGVICYLGMLFIHKELAVLIAVLVGVTNVIPYFGPFLGGIPSGLLLLAVSPSKAIIFALFILVLQQIDGNVIAPAILGDTIGLSPLMVVVSIFLFTGIMGTPGVFFGTPLFAMVYSLMRRVVQWLLKRKELPLSTRAYATEENPLPPPKEK